MYKQACKHYILSSIGSAPQIIRSTWNGYHINYIYFDLRYFFVCFEKMENICCCNVYIVCSVFGQLSMIQSDFNEHKKLSYSNWTKSSATSIILYKFSECLVDIYTQKKKEGKIPTTHMYNSASDDCGFVTLTNSNVLARAQQITFHIFTTTTKNIIVIPREGLAPWNYTNK